MSKLTINAYSDPQLKKSIGSYAVRVNPEKFSRTEGIAYDTTIASGSAKTRAKYKNAQVPTLRFELLFDATGVIPGSPTDLAQEIETFRQIVLGAGRQDQSPYLELIWGSFVFQGRVSSLSFNYTLFSSSGAPLRARAETSFNGFNTPATAQADLTGLQGSGAPVVTAGEDESLPALSEEHLGDAGAYPDVARANDLDSLREPLAGRRLAMATA